MKTIITICIGLLLAGCGPNFDWSALGRGLGDYSRQQQEIANQQNAQSRENAIEINRQLQRNTNPNYWQELRARQEYYQSLGID